MKRLRIAKSTGWKAEFPLELWSLILQYSLGNADHMDLKLALCMASVSKAHLAIVLPHCQRLLRTIIMNRYARQQQTAYETEQHGELVRHFLVGINGRDDWLFPKTTPSAYVCKHLPDFFKYCATLDIAAGTEGYQHRHRVIDAVSLVHFIWLERRARLNFLLERRLKVANDGDDVGRVVHFSYVNGRKNKVARSLPRIADVVTTMLNPDELQELARSYCDRNEESSGVSAELRAQLDHEQQSTRLSAAMRIQALATDEKLNLHVTQPRYHDSFRKVLFKRTAGEGGGYHHILSDECRAFAADCFFTLEKATISTSTLACTLTQHHDRNWTAIRQSERFRAPSWAQ